VNVVRSASVESQFLASQDATGILITRLFPEVNRYGGVKMLVRISHSLTLGFDLFVSTNP